MGRYPQMFLFYTNNMTISTGRLIKRNKRLIRKYRNENYELQNTIIIFKKTQSQLLLSRQDLRESSILWFGVVILLAIILVIDAILR